MTCFVVLKMVFVNHWYILWSQIKVYVTLILLAKNNWEAGAELEEE